MNGGGAHSGKRDECDAPTPIPTSTPAPGPMSSVGDSGRVGRLQATQDCMWQKMTLELDTEYNRKPLDILGK